jgi:hypothetical protein
LLAGVGQHEAAALALGAEAAATLTVPLRAREQAQHEAAVAAVQSALGARRFQAIAQRAAALTFGELIAELRAVVAALPADG